MKKYYMSQLLFLLLLIPTLVLAETTAGVILPMTGDFARYGEKVRASLESKLDPRLRFVYEDEGCNPKSAASAYQKLTAMSGIKLFIGPWCGSPQVVVAGLLRKADQIAILGSSAPERVYELSDGRMFSVQPSIESESKFNAEKAMEMGAKRVVILFLKNDFSRAHEAAFRENFKGDVLERLTYATSDAAALKPLIMRIRQLHPDTLYVPDAAPLMHGLLKQLVNLGLKELRVISVYSAQAEDVLAAMGDAGEGLLYSYPKIEGRALEYFPQLAVTVLNFALDACPSQASACISAAIKKRFDFDEHGTLPGELMLKTVRAGNFVPVGPPHTSAAF
jgi:ABC-type branched-subunit amino acid transport system substrate-binding protein